MNYKIISFMILISSIISNTHYHFHFSKTKNHNKTRKLTIQNFREVRTIDEFNQEISNNNKVVVFFYADWSGPSRYYGPIYEQFAKENPSVRFLKVNVDIGIEISNLMKLRTIPVVISFSNGEEKDRQPFTETNLRKMVDDLEKV